MVKQQIRENCEYSSVRARRDANRLLSIGLAFVLSLFLGACQSTSIDTATLAPSSNEHPVYTLGTNDKISVSVHEHESLSGEFTVDDSGEISLSLVGRIKVKGLTVAQLEQLVIEQLSAHYIANPKVNIELIAFRPFCIIGEVNNQGCFPYVYGLTTAKAVAFAGGYTYRAKKSEMIITREDGRKVAATGDTPIFSGDVIEVLERFF